MTRIEELLDAIGPEAEDCVEKILREYLRARKKYPNWPDDPVHASAVLNEEAGELTQAALDFYNGNAGDSEHMINEAVQTGAMSLRFLMHAGQYLPALLWKSNE
jgi:thioesterase domain-containing protein